ncbi:MAG: formate C-acetyltransferase/glycerol dehydratase family glycyl radical enzyme, partial [Candidatus Krumholzibacteria bacterium]|nr:formate C-acetyltransferase/glycerol dehydratase family glycyl radical enzyme [Candidatus Krumholzibacteria bacterium]
VARLRKQSLEAVPHISAERAVLVTSACRDAETTSAPIRRALVFKHILENKAICINEGELIVGERGPEPKATPTYPEMCCHSLEDLDILNDRDKIPFIVSNETRREYEDHIISFWKGRTLREKIFSRMTEEWKLAFGAGVFTEFMEQRAPGHTVLDDKIYRKGFLDFKEDIRGSLAELDEGDDSEAVSEREQLQAMDICADALIAFARRYSEKAGELAAVEEDPERRTELERIAGICLHVPAHPPRDLWEALQYYWFVHLGVITELNPWDAFNPGRLDQHLLPFYRKGIEEGTLTREKAKELIQCLWVKFNNQLAPPKVGVTAEESATYTDFVNINLGGLRADGENGANEVSFLLLEVIDEMKLVQPSSNIQLSEKTPDELLNKACAIIRKGWGQPSLFNADMVVEELTRQGKSIEDAMNGGTSGCIETGAFGKESYILTGYFNFPKVFEITLNNGIDPETGNKVGIETGRAEDFEAFEDLLDAYEKQLRHFIDIKIEGNNVIERLFAEEMPVPFLSIIIDDCIANGKDYNAGGARYNTTYIQGVGLGTLTDCLASVKYHVFDEGTLRMADLMDALSSDFEGNERMRQMLINRTPRYGNDDDYPDSLMLSAFEIFFNAVDGRKNTKGGHHRINLLPTTCHIYFGRVTGATPDGRRAWQ